MRYLIFILWLLLGVFYWCMKEACCDGTSAAAAAPIGAVDSGPCPGTTPYSVKWGSINPLNMSSTNWDSLSSAFTSKLNANQSISINGTYRAEESYTGKDHANLGLARANKILELLKLDSKKVKIGANKVNAGKRDRNCAFTGTTVDAIVSSKNIKEEVVKDDFGNVSKRTTIYFPFNSTNKLNDSEVENYLDDVAKRVKSTGEKVNLTGHTDNVGGNGPNIALGQRRADIVKNYLIKKGVSPNKIITNSKGESAPIATNDTDQGRAKNRRTELQIIK